MGALSVPPLSNEDPDGWRLNLERAAGDTSESGLHGKLSPRRPCSSDVPLMVSAAESHSLVLPAVQRMMVCPAG